MSSKSSSAVTTMGIHIGKNTFHLIGLDERGAIVLRQKWSRGQLEARLANTPPCLIGMEACVGAHHLSRKLQEHGHNARLMPAKYVRPYSKGQKNDFRDAEAIAEAVQRPTMKFVATKTADQLDLQALHRVRERWNCPASSPSVVTSCRRAWCGSSRTWPVGKQKNGRSERLTTKAPYKAGYIDARPYVRQIDEISCDARPDHTSGSGAASRIAKKLGEGQTKSPDRDRVSSQP
jgi:hypothetical protein